MATSVSSVTSHFPDAENGFTTTTSGSVSAGATTVGLNSTSGYTNGEPVVFVIDPTDTTKKQTFTGLIDTSGNQVTSVVWTAGTNVAHDAGATVVDYATATHIAMISKGIKVEHAQDGTHKSALITSRTEDTSPASGDFILTADVSDSNNLKKVQLNNIQKAITFDTSLMGGITNPYKFEAYRNAAWTASNGSMAKVAFDAESYDSNSNFDSTTNNRYTAPVAGFYLFSWGITFELAAAGLGISALYKNGSSCKQGGASVQGATGAGFTTTGSAVIQVAASDYFEVYAQAAATGTGSTGANLTYFNGILLCKT